MSDLSAVVFETRGLLAVSGEESRDFLQNLVSNDVTKISPARAVFATLLTPQGKYLHDFFVAEMTLGGETALVLDTEAGRLAELMRRLTMYKLRAKLDLREVSGDFAAIAAFGDGAAEAMGLTGSQEGAARAFASGISFVDPRYAALGVRALVPRGNAAAAMAASGFALADEAAYERHRLALGVPDGSRDVIVDKSMPLEYGFDDLHAIDYEKGCYVGQELTARTHHRGTSRKRLYRVDIDGTPPPPGTQILFGETKAGEMRSACGDLGLALLRTEHVEAAEQAGKPLVADGAKLTPVKPAWARF
jgi:hypothetical protein